MLLFLFFLFFHLFSPSFPSSSYFLVEVIFFQKQFGGLYIHFSAYFLSWLEYRVMDDNDDIFVSGY
jgi:hypothetical protein